MTLIFETIKSDGIAQLSYFLGDDSSRTAAVVDPRPDCEVYLRLAERFGVAITHIFETHIHADFMSGSRELQERLAGAAVICVSGHDDPDYGYDCSRIRGGERFRFGDLVVTARHTPGHTPEHLSYELADGEQTDRPWGVLSGDSLFVGSAGRPDLLGEEETETLVEQLFHTLHDYYLKLDDDVIVFPCHGAGSACGADIGDRPQSTIGRERWSNQFLQSDDFDKFKEQVTSDAPPVPAHYPRLKKVNLAPKVTRRVPPCPPLEVERFAGLLDEEVTLLDTRDMLAFGGGHIPGAINIGDRTELSTWAGDMLPPDKQILLVNYADEDVDEIVSLLWRVGITEFTGYLAGGMDAWNRAGRKLTHLRQMTVHELDEQRESIQVLDVRTRSEFENGRVPGARHYYVGDMREMPINIDEVDPGEPVAVYCGSGYRASIAASLLQCAGFKDVRSVPGSWSGWTDAGYEIETPQATHAGAG
jgi:hydroxyacylglutathione hydrolase